MKIKLTDQNRTGLLPEHRKGGVLGGVLGGGISTRSRMTIAAREAFRSASGAEVQNDAFYFAIPPKGVVCVLAPADMGSKWGGMALAFRLESEEPFPCEEPNTYDMWTEVLLTPCPKCGFALVRYEAGYVPGYRGYRVCAGKHHHYQVSRLVGEHESA